MNLQVMLRSPNINIYLGMESGCVQEHNQVKMN
jgi:hypothetical protein